MSATASTHPGALPTQLVPPPVPPILYVSFGVVLLLIPVIAIIIRPSIDTIAPVYLRVVSACGGALIGAVVPGLLNVRLPAVKAGGALGVFAVIFFLNPPQTVNDSVVDRVKDSTFNSWDAYRNARPAAERYPSIEKPATFPLSFGYTDPATKRKGRIVYDAAKRVFVENTGFPAIPFYYFRPVRYDNGVLWLYDDNRGFTLRLPADGGVCDLSADGFDGHFSELYRVKVEKRT